MIKIVKIFGDKYIARKTYNINELGFGIYGYEIYNDNEIFLAYFGGIEKLVDLKNRIKASFYGNYICKNQN